MVLLDKQRRDSVNIGKGWKWMAGITDALKVALGDRYAIEREVRLVDNVQNWNLHPDGDRCVASLILSGTGAAGTASDDVKDRHLGGARLVQGVERVEVN